MAEWFERRTWAEPSWTVAGLVAAKAGRTVSVVLPALDEEATVGGVVAAVHPMLGSLVDELVVVDSGSTDATAAVARAAGARVVTREEALPGVAVRPGKGEVLWRALAATTGDLVVYLDADLVDLDPGFVPSLLGPLLTAPGVELVKGFYHRPLRLGDHDAVRDGGGRVTELVARPALAALRPELAGIVQPLGGEYAATRDLLESLPFAGGYGVEIGLLLDTHERRGLDAIGQVDLGVRKHRHRSLRELGVTSAEVLSAVLRRCGLPDNAAEHADRGAGRLTQFVPVGGHWLPEDHAVAVHDRPPIRQYSARR
ncbi:glucosyl-3-phosphoglycerate synthase [Actinomycetospora chiangmaiensis]|uniref:glucosyl-3-phosphoglycerate synthase n=1 Tax=Actinomycetospora chiangmaiensis TaxID=402650 RepID=UPI000370D620|nr:glucosyl-3-phosphoglycerate synthase [Actinomycetospora chiangmaiensis]